MALRPDKLADLGLRTNDKHDEPIVVSALPVVVVAVELKAADLDVGAPATIPKFKREQLGFYWQELNKQYWAADGTGIRCGTCAFFDDGTKPNEPRKDEYNLVGTCRLMDIEDARVHSQACCNLFRRPRNVGGLNPENDMWPPTYPASCPPDKGKLVLRDCGATKSDKVELDKLEKAKDKLAQELKLVKEQKKTVDSKTTTLVAELAALKAELAAAKKSNQQLVERQKKVQNDRVELKKQAADAAQKLTRTTASVQQTLSAVQKTA